MEEKTHHVRLSECTPAPSVAELRALFEPRDARARNAQEFAGLPEGTFRRASVLIPLFYKDGELRILLTRRAENLRTHAGYVAFPGGMADDEDVDEVATALREAEEEIGLDPKDVDVIAVFSQAPVRPISLVSPVLGLIPPDFVPKINQAEVAFVFDLPLSRFLLKDRRSIDHFPVPMTDLVYCVHHFLDMVGDQEVDTWGFTASFCISVALVAYQSDQVVRFQTDKVTTKDSALQSSNLNVILRYNPKL